MLLSSLRSLYSLIISDALFPFHLISFQNLENDLSLFIHILSHNLLELIFFFKISHQLTNVFHDLFDYFILSLVDSVKLLLVMDFICCPVQFLFGMLGPFEQVVSFENLLVKESWKINWMELSIFLPVIIVMLLVFLLLEGDTIRSVWIIICLLSLELLFNEIILVVDLMEYFSFNMSQGWSIYAIYFDGKMIWLFCSNFSIFYFFVALYNIISHWTPFIICWPG